MAKDYSKRSRLSRIEEKQSLKQAMIFLLLTIVFIVLLIVFGIPLLIKLIVFLGDLRTTQIMPVSDDKLAPVAPVIEPAPEATFSSSLTLKGWSESGSTVKLYLNGIDKKDIVADKEGRFVFDNIQLKKGENEFTAKATDSAGNESTDSKSIVIIFDNEAPKLEITNPKDGQEFFYNDRQITVTGSTEPNITVLINDRLVYSDAKGSFDKSLELHEGENMIKIVAKDKAGNETSITVGVNYRP